MSAPRYGMILIVSGPSGSGKSTLCEAMFREFQDLEFSVSCTTRAPRGEERDGVEYHFLTREQFEEHIRRDDFLEYAEVHGNFYGTLKSEVFDRTERGVTCCSTSTCRARSQSGNASLPTRSSTPAWSRSSSRRRVIRNWNGVCADAAPTRRNPSSGGWKIPNGNCLSGGNTNM